MTGRDCCFWRTYEEEFLGLIRLRGSGCGLLGHPLPPRVIMTCKKTRLPPLTFSAVKRDRTGSTDSSGTPAPCRVWAAYASAAFGYGPPTAGCGPPPPPPLEAVAPPFSPLSSSTPMWSPYRALIPTLGPGIGVDVLFYGGSWYRPFGGRWFRAASYRRTVALYPQPQVPGVLVHLPGG